MKKNLSASFLTLLLFFALGTSLIYAANGDGDTGPGGGTGTTGCKATICIENPFRVGSTLFQLLETVVNKIIMPIGGILAVMAFVYSGFLYVMAQGNDSKLKTAHQALLYTAIGTAVLLGAWTLANVIKTTINNLM